MCKLTLSGFLVAVLALVLVGCGSIKVEVQPPRPATALDNHLFPAAQRGDIDTIKRALESGAYVTAQGQKGETPLHEAAYNGRTGAVSFLIEKGADVNAQAEQGDTPLHVAAWRGRSEIAKLLLEKGANVHARNSQGMSPLHMAALYDEKQTAALLIDNGADVNERDTEGGTPCTWLHCEIKPKRQNFLFSGKLTLMRRQMAA